MGVGYNFAVDYLADINTTHEDRLRYVNLLLLQRLPAALVIFNLAFKPF
jgi:hypothetical protein